MEGTGNGGTAGAVPVRTTPEGHALGVSKTDFELHILLIVKQDKLAKSKALYTAYCEGPAGLAKRLGK